MLRPNTLMNKEQLRAGQTLAVDRERLVARANELGMVVVAFDGQVPEDGKNE